MKRKTLKMGVASLVVFLLVGVMGVTSAFTAFSVDSISNATSERQAVAAGITDVSTASLLDSDKVAEVSNALDADDKVGLTIQMDDTALVDVYLANPGSYASFAEYRQSPEGKNAAENLIRKQEVVFNKIARQVDVTLKYNYVNIINGFAIEIKYGDRAKIDKIAYGANVKGTVISDHYDAPQTTVTTNRVNALDTGIFDSSLSEWRGDGIVVAVLDTGLDWEHVAFNPYSPAFGLEEQQENETLKFTKDYIEKNLSALKANPYNNSKTGNGVSNLKVDDVYLNEKVPYAFDYADYDAEVNTHIDNMHGTHVAGIIAGHSDTPYRTSDGTTYFEDSNGKFYYLNSDRQTRIEAENGVISGKDGDKEIKITVNKDADMVLDTKDEQVTGIMGVAPRAQLAIMKVFGDYESGAESDGLWAALEDCATLGVDVINMSLGSNSGFQDESDARDSIYSSYDKLGQIGVSLVVAASNAYSSGFNTHFGLNLTSNPDSGTIGSPASYDAAFSVASISGVKSKYLLATDGSKDDSNPSGYMEYGAAYFEESAHVNSEPYDFIDDLKNLIYARKDEEPYATYWKHYEETNQFQIEYVTIPGTGDSPNYATKNVRGKIALVSRGTLSFEDKIEKAMNNGAIACVVFNNASGIIRMQVGDDIKTPEGLPFPSCSIKMDAAASIKNKDTLTKPAYLIIDDTMEAGPFMSDFSSWGPLTNLVLKPEITAHGGDIYSAAPGDETSYARISGTSMACPNMAGVVAILRQFMQTKDNMQAFGLDIDGNGKVDTVEELNDMEAIIYSMLMSTATIANNEEGNPYSPRKQGAGLADLLNTEQTKQYLIGIKDLRDENNQPTGKEERTERPKLELLDDPDRTGVYTLKFYIKNVGDKQEYTLKNLVMTEGVSSDGKTVTETAVMITDSAESFTVNGTPYSIGDKFNVDANTEAKVEVTIKLSDATKKYLNDNFKNGMYVEGFVTLDNTNNKLVDKFSKHSELEVYEGVDLNIPFLAFYGDWGDAPMIDYDIYETSKDENDDNIDEDDKRYSNAHALQIFGKFVENGAEYVLGLGQNPFLVPDEYEEATPDVEEDKAALSINSTAMSNIYCVGSFLRGAKKLFYTIKNETTGEVMVDSTYMNARKGGGAAGLGGGWLDIDISKDMLERTGDSILTDKYGKGVFSNGKYSLTIYPVLDWYADRFDTKEDYIAYCEDYNEKHPGNEKRYMWSSSFWVDSDAPFISSAAVRISRDRNDNARYFLDLNVTDNHYVSAMSFNYYNEHNDKFESIFSENGLRPINGVRNSTTLVSFEITDIWEDIQQGILEYKNTDKRSKKTQIQTLIYDYAFNRSFYTIDLIDLIENLQDVKFGDIGMYKTYTNPSTKDKIEIMTSQNNEVTFAADGSFKELTEFSLIEGQTVNLMKAVVPTPSTAWREDFSFSCNPDGVAKIDPETGILIAKGEGTATIRVQSRSNASIKASINLRVYSKQAAQDYNVTGISYGRTSYDGLSLKEYGTVLNAGETYTLEIKNLEPWYLDLDTTNYFVLWESGNISSVTVAPDATNPLKATITANAGKYFYDAKGNLVDYEKNVASSTQGTKITATVCRYTDSEDDPIDPKTGKHYRKTNAFNNFTAFVYQEFVVNGNELTEYHGSAKEKYVQKEGGPVIRNGIAYELKTLTPDEIARDKVTVEIPNTISVTKLAGSLFYKNSTIERIIINDDVETIGYAACAYMPKLKEVVLPKRLMTIEGYAFAAYVPTTYAGQGDPDTQLSIVDMTRCERPIYVQRNAFAMQWYIGVDLENSYGDTLVPLKNNPFVTTKVRTADQFSFYGLRNLKEIDLTGLRASGNAAFAYLGVDLPSGQGTKVKFSDKTVINGQSAFQQNGIEELEIPFKRINMSTFVGTYSSTTGAITFNRLKKLTFTADDVYIASAAFAFNGANGLDIEFKGSVDYIGDGAFMGCRINNIKFDSTCREIGEYAFEQVFNLESIELPAGLEKIGALAFHACSSLKTVTINKDCKLDLANEGLADSIFYGCDISEFKMADGAEGNGTETLSIKNGCIYNKQGTVLKLVPNSIDFNAHSVETILDGVEEIAPYAFSGNKNLDKIDLTGINKIGEGAFSNCTALTEVTLPSTLTEIPDYMFTLCTSLETVNGVNSSSIKRIGQEAFRNCAFDKITLGSNINEIAYRAFAGNTKLNYFEMPTALKKVGSQAFLSCSALANVRFANVTEIEDAAFAMTGLTSVVGTKVTKVGADAFNGCEKLTTVQLNSVTEIGDAAFYPAGVEDEDGNVVSLAPSIETLQIGAVQKVGASAFYGQEKIKELYIDNVVEIGDSAFYGLNNLELQVNLGGYGMQQINMILLPYAKKIGPSAFEGTNIEYVYLGQDIEYLDSTAFMNSENCAYMLNASYDGAQDDNGTYFVDNGVLYKHIPYGTELVSYPSARYGEIDYTLRDDTTRIAEFAFSGTKYLVRVNIPENVAYIGDGAFLGSNIAIYNFLGMNAPELETGVRTYQSQFYDEYAWQLYRNFNSPFNWDFTADEYKYLSVRMAAEEDVLLYISVQNQIPFQNTSYLGEGFVNRTYSMILSVPANAKGFDTFVWSNYFDCVNYTKELLEDGTKIIMDMIDALPQPDDLTEGDAAKVSEARSKYDALRSLDQKSYIQDEGLYDKLLNCEAKMVELLGTTETQKVRVMLDFLPDPDSVTAADRETIEKVRAAYDALSDDEKDGISQDLVDKLTACEAKLNNGGSGEGDGNGDEDNGGCGSCGTVAFGNGGSGTGLMIGLIVTLAACVLIVLLRKKKATSKK